MEIGKIGRIEEVGTVDEKGDWNDIWIYEYAVIYIPVA
jgi:hypothetical protein